MPRQTFFNLPPEKRQLIEQAALDEFSEHGFDNAVLNRIVAKSGIAKGSFYQYFEDMKDLYFHLIDTLFKKKREYIEPVMKCYKEHCFSHNLREIIYKGLEFSEDDPKLQKLSVDFAAKHQPFFDEFMEIHKPETLDINTALLLHAQENGELREDLDLSLVSFFVYSLINQATILIMNKLEAKKQNRKIIEELLSFIERAISK